MTHVHDHDRDHNHDQAARGSALGGLIAPAVAALVALAILIALGTWQMQRLAWKQGLIASIAEGLRQEPAPLESPPDAWAALGQQEYRPVSVSGRFRHEDERRLFAVQDGEMGWHIYTPLETEGGKLLFVNRGFVPEALKYPARRPEGQIAGTVAVRGLTRRPGVQGWFDPEADPARNVWFWRDLAGMTASLGSGQTDRPVLPFFVEAAAEPANPGGWPRGGVTRLDIPNRHLEYALTWYGLAATLVAVFAAFAWMRLRGPSSTHA